MAELPPRREYAAPAVAATTLGFWLRPLARWPDHPHDACQNALDLPHIARHLRQPVEVDSAPPRPHGVAPPASGLSNRDGHVPAFSSSAISPRRLHIRDQTVRGISPQLEIDLPSLPCHGGDAVVGSYHTLLGLAYTQKNCEEDDRTPADFTSGSFAVQAGHAGTYLSRSQLLPSSSAGGLAWVISRAG